MKKKSEELIRESLISTPEELFIKYSKLQKTHLETKRVSKVNLNKYYYYLKLYKEKDLEYHEIFTKFISYTTIADNLHDVIVDIKSMSLIQRILFVFSNKSINKFLENYQNKNEA